MRENNKMLDYLAVVEVEVVGNVRACTKLEKNNNNACLYDLAGQRTATSTSTLDGG